MTGAPRNRPAFEAGQRKRQAIREILAAHSPLLPPLKLEDIQTCLVRRGIYLAQSTIAFHRSRIWEEAAVIDDSSNYSSNDSEAA